MSSAGFVGVFASALNGFACSLKGFLPAVPSCNHARGF